MNEKKQKKQHPFAGRLLYCLAALFFGFLIFVGIPKEVSADVTGRGTERDPYVVTEYDDLKSQMAAAPTDGTICYIELGDNISDISDGTMSDNKTLELTDDSQKVVLDLKGYTIYRKANTTDRALFDFKGGSLTIRDTGKGGKYGAIKANLYSGDSVQHGVIHTFSDSSGELNLELNEETSVSAEHPSMYCIYTEGGMTTIQNGSFIANTNVLFADGGRIYIYGGTYKPKETYGIAIYNNGTYLNVNGGTFKSSDGTAFYIGYHNNLSVNIRNCIIENSMQFAGYISSLDYFDENASITFTQAGIKKTCSPDDIESTTWSSDDKIVVATPMYITDATFSVTTPRAGEHPSMTALTNDYCIKNAEVSWKNVTTGTLLSATDTYEKGNDYLLTLTLTARDGWLFSNTAKPSIKVYDYEMTLKGITDGGKKATYTYKYSIKADRPTITKQAARQTITEGDSVTLQIEAENATSYTWYYTSCKGLDMRVSESGLYYEKGTEQTDTLKLNYFDYLHSGGTFYCCVEGPGGSINSSQYMITVNPFDYNIWVGGTQVISANKRQICEGVRYSPYNNRLTLYNASVTGYNTEKDNGYEINYSETGRGEFLIKLEGDCSIGNTTIRGYGIRTEQTPLIIQGSGKEDKLTIYSGNGGITRCHGLTVKNCTLNITTEGTGNCIKTSVLTDTVIQDADVSLYATSSDKNSFAVDFGSESSKNTLTISGDSTFTAFGNNKALNFNPNYGPSAIIYHAGATVKVGTDAGTAQTVNKSTFSNEKLLDYNYVSIKTTKTPINIARITVPALSSGEALPAPKRLQSRRMFRTIIGNW